jgi:hypothetical protein
MAAFWIVVAILVLAALIVTAALRMRVEAHTRKVTERRRSPELEARIKTVLAGPRQKYGDIFTDYTVWKSERETRLELTATPKWKKLNEFTRSLVVRYLWRVLESLAGGAVVIVDEPAQVWNEEVDSSFRDQGFDWKTFGSGPQYVNDP